MPTRERVELDHPRSRGVYGADTCLRTREPGSSPLARGLRAVTLRVDLNHGIIPARAGFTTPGRRGRGCTGDHPRSRGVYFAAAVATSVPAGSSPLARGLRPADPGADLAVGIIPARAGFTPRPLSISFIAEGSSPLARGLPHLTHHAATFQRIIPARAGFTWSPHRSPSRTRDHPRSRGVYPATSATGTRSSGSSPLARGLPMGLTEDEAVERIIPARAGFTIPEDAVRRIGEGSSPLARGLLVLAWWQAWDRGDHPRSRGVYLRQVHSGNVFAGSSPLARGLPHTINLHSLQHGIIPARAGFT